MKGIRIEKKMAVMMVLTGCFALIGIMLACAPPPPPGTLTSSKVENSRIFNKPYDSVWSAVVKTLAIKGYSISIQDKNTGTIFTGYYSLGTEAHVLTSSVERRAKLNILVEKKTDVTTEVSIAVAYEESALGLERVMWEVTTKRPNDLINLEKELLDAFQLKL